MSCEPAAWRLRSAELLAWFENPSVRCPRLRDMHACGKAYSQPSSTGSVRPGSGPHLDPGSPRRVGWQVRLPPQGSVPDVSKNRVVYRTRSDVFSLRLRGLLRRSATRHERSNDETGKDEASIQRAAACEGTACGGRDGCHACGFANGMPAKIALTPIPSSFDQLVAFAYYVEKFSRRAMAYLRLIPRLAPNKTQTLTLTQTLDLTQNLHLTLHPPLTPTPTLSARLAFAVPPAQAFASNGGAACPRHCLTTAAREGSVRPRSRNKSARLSADVRRSRCRSRAASPACLRAPRYAWPCAG